MLEIANNIPWFVLPLLAVLLIGGFKASKNHRMSLKVLVLLPIIFFCWALFSFFGRYGSEPVSVTLWIFCLIIGFSTGFAHLQTLSLGFDKDKGMIEMPGSWIPLLLSLSMFSSKFSAGMLKTMLPHLQDSSLFLGLELFSTIILGIFAGRGLNCFLRYRSSELHLRS